MKLLRAVALGAAIAMAMAGCVHGPRSGTSAGDTAPDAVDGVWCGDPAHESSARTYVNVTYADDGMPAASPASCEVKQGTEIVWRGPSGNPTPFKLDFPGGPPGRGDPESAAAPDGGRQKVILWATAAPGTYKYGISANGKHLDPDVIIKPR